MTTARQIIKKAFQKIGVLFINDEPSAEEANDALFSLNAMVSSWSNRSMLIYVRTVDNLVFQGGVGTYTIGPAADFNTVRPILIVSAYVTVGDISYPMEIISDEEYANISYKGLIGQFPQFMNYTNGYPTGTLRFSNLPAAAYPFTLYSEKQLSSFGSLDTEIEFPPGWEHALIYNLAIMLAPEYGQESSQAAQLIAPIAKDALASIKTAIQKNRDMDYPRNISNTDNVYAGWYY